MSRYTTAVRNTRTGDVVHITLPSTGPETARGEALCWAFRFLQWNSTSAAHPGQLVQP